MDLFTCPCLFILPNLLCRKEGIENAVYTDAEQQQGPNHYTNILEGRKQSEYCIMEVWNYILFVKLYFIFEGKRYKENGTKQQPI